MKLFNHFYLAMFIIIILFLITLLAGHDEWIKSSKEIKIDKNNNSWPPNNLHDLIEYLGDYFLIVEMSNAYSNSYML